MAMWITSNYIKGVNEIIKEESFTYIEEIVLQNSKKINLKIHADLSMLEAMAVTFETLEPEEYEKTLKAFNENPKFDSFQRFGMIQANGYGLNDIDFSDRKYFKLAMQGVSSISDILLSRVENINVNVYATPIRKDGEILGVLTGTVVIDRYKDILFSKVLDKKTESFIFKDNGSIIACSKHNGAGNHNNNIFDEIKVIKNSTEFRKIGEKVKNEGKIRLSFIAEDGLENYFNIHYLGVNDWYLGIIIPSKVVEQKLQNTIKSNSQVAEISIFILILSSLYIIYIQKKSENMLVKLAYYDELTGYPNKNFFVSKGNLLISEYKNNYAYVILNIRQFKIVNDKYGYKKGNELLKHISNILASEIESNEICSRFVADNFHMILIYANNEELEDRIERMNE
ncbi:MAG: diguanylate cyclase, partial [Proteocatella sp.]